MKRIWVGAFAIVLVCVTGIVMMTARPAESDASAATGTAASTEQNLQAPTQNTFAQETGSSILRMITALAIVLACIYGCVFLLKRFGPNNIGRSGEKRLLQMIDSIAVGPKKIIAVVRVGERAVVVGITDSQMTSLTELEMADLPTNCPDKKTYERAASKNFAGVFHMIWNGHKKTAKAIDTQATTFV